MGIEKMNQTFNIDQSFDHQMSLSKSKCWYSNKRTSCISHHCRKTTVSSFHRCLINTSIEKMNKTFNIDQNFDHQMSLSKSIWLYSNNCLHFLKCAVPLSLLLLSLLIFFLANEQSKTKDIKWNKTSNIPYFIAVQCV